MESGRKVFRGAHMPPLTLAIFLTGYFVVLLIYVFSAPLLMPDEMVVAAPAMNHIRGVPFPVNLYGYLPYYIYEVYFRLIALFSSVSVTLDVAIVQGRVLNSFLSIVNLTLFFLLLRRYFDAWLALAATVILGLMPAYVFCSVFLKTETLQVLEITLLLLVADRIVKKPELLWNHVLAGVLCAMAVATKYNIFVAIIYAVAWLPSARSNKTTALKNLAIFGVATVVAVVVFWPGILEVIRDGGFRGMERDQYFLPFPTISRAVDETWAFPYGRFSYSLVVFPVAAGYAPVILTLIAFWRKLIDLKLFFQWGLFALVYLFVYHVASLVRTGYVFNTLLPFIAMAAASALKTVRQNTSGFAHSRNLRLIVVAGVFGLMVYQSFSMVKLVSSIVNVTNAKKQHYGQQLDVLITSAATLATGIDPMDIENSLGRRNTRYLLVLDSYLQNYCKYRHNERYAAQCDFFQRLLAGRTYFSLEEKIVLDFPLKYWIFDPEGSYTFLLFRRTGY
ncbi:MAG: glycosyltransferase family 39 protein [Leptospiraceae bacterium]|nr:glycosyltransferase family 39 protein [Leptospiraceae bacterium]